MPPTICFLIDSAKTDILKGFKDNIPVLGKGNWATSTIHFVPLTASKSHPHSYNQVRNAPRLRSKSAVVQSWVQQLSSRPLLTSLWNFQAERWPVIGSLVDERAPSNESVWKTLLLTRSPLSPALRQSFCQLFLAFSLLQVTSWRQKRTKGGAKAMEKFICLLGSHSPTPAHSTAIYFFWRKKTKKRRREKEVIHTLKKKKVSRIAELSSCKDAWILKVGKTTCWHTDISLTVFCLALPILSRNSTPLSLPL